MSAYRFLFSPIQLGPVKVPNRVVFSAHLTNYAQNGLPSEKLKAYYLERAKGGAGLIIIEEQSVHTSDFAYEKLIHAFSPKVVPLYRALTSEVQLAGAKIFCQLNHNGLQGFSFFNDDPLLGPSPVGDGLFREVPATMNVKELEAVIDGYALVARHAREGGFDGVELQASHSSVLRQFMSPYTNKRNDHFGGSLENRLRLTHRVIAAVRDALGPSLALGIRLCTDELVDGGLKIEEVVEIARNLADSVDFINTSIGTTGRLYMVEGPMSVPSGYQSGHTSQIRQAVDVPVIGVGRINDPVMAERLLVDGVADMVGVVRAQIADPQWALKSLRGEAAEIRKCIACNQYCIGLMGLNRPLSCIQNPANGEEARFSAFGSHEKTGVSKRVLVAGGGPAGMEAAITAAKQGHQVVLFEAEAQLGGNVNQIVKVPSRLEYGDLIRNKVAELEKYEVEVRLETRLTQEMALEINPDALIVATGQKETRPGHIPGMEGPKVKTPLEILSNPRPKPCHVLISDDIGFHQSTSLAEYLAEGGCRITLVTSAFYAGQELGITLDLELWHMRMAPYEVSLMPGHILLDASGDPQLLDIYANQTRTLEGVDLIVPVNHGRPENSLYQALKDKIPYVVRVGDALAPKDVGEAILDGFRAASQMSGVDTGWK